MIKQGFKNYITCLRYVFTPLGVLALALIWGLSIALPGIAGCFAGLGEQLKSLAAEFQLDLPALAADIGGHVTGLDWSDPNAALETLLNEEWLTATLTECLRAAGVDAEAIAQEFTAAVLEAFARAALYLLLVGGFVFVGLFAGTLITKKLIRKTIARRSLRKTLVVMLVDALLSATLVFLLACLVLFGNLGAALTLVLCCLLFGFISLLEAYIIHARGRMPMRRIVNLRNIGGLLCSDLLLFLLAGVLILLLALFATPIVSSLLGMTLTQITLLVVGMNAESYVLRVVPAAPEEPGTAPDGQRKAGARKSRA